MSYATLAELRTQIGKVGTTGAGADAALQIILDAATSAIDGFCNRPDGFVADAAASARYFAGSGLAYQFIDECVEITVVAVKDSVTDLTYVTWDAPTTNMAGDGDWLAFSGDPQMPDFQPLSWGRPYTALMVDPNGDYSIFTGGAMTGRGGFRPSTTISRGLPSVKVTGRWGFSATAPKTVVEACIVQAARWFKRGESGWSDALASGELGMLMYRKALDPDVQMMLVESRLIRPAMGRSR